MRPLVFIVLFLYCVFHVSFFFERHLTLLEVFTWQMNKARSPKVFDPLMDFPIWIDLVLY